jgi:hypothetical protein
MLSPLPKQALDGADLLGVIEKRQSRWHARLQ